LLRPPVCLGHDSPDEGAFGFRIDVPLLYSRVLVSKRGLQLTVWRGNLRVGPQEVAKEQRKLLTEAASLPDVDMGPARARRFAEVALGAFRVVSAEDIAQSSTWCSK
jgi:hypothetical protein